MKEACIGITVVIFWGIQINNKPTIGLPFATNINIRKLFAAVVLA